MNENQKSNGNATGAEKEAGNEAHLAYKAGTPTGQKALPRIVIGWIALAIAVPILIGLSVVALVAFSPIAILCGVIWLYKGFSNWLVDCMEAAIETIPRKL